MGGIVVRIGREIAMRAVRLDRACRLQRVNFIGLIFSVKLHSGEVRARSKRSDSYSRKSTELNYATEGERCPRVAVSITSKFHLYRFKGIRVSK